MQVACPEVRMAFRPPEIQVRTFIAPFIIMLLARQKQPLQTGVVGLPHRQHTLRFFYLDPVLGGLVSKLNCLWREVGWWIFIW